MWLGDDLPSDVLLDRQKRQLGRNSLLPGSFSAKGFPNTLIKVQVRLEKGKEGGEIDEDRRERSQKIQWG
jgi:hypothetical protein